MDSGQASIVVSYLADDEIAQAAAQVRERYLTHCQGISVALNPENLIWNYLDEHERLSLDTEDALGKSKYGDKIAGSMTVLDNGGLICIDCEIVGSPLYVFTLAHEIGHWVLHRQHIMAAQAQGNLFDDAPKRMVTLHRNVGTAHVEIPREEWQANRFATHLLMPDFLVREQFAYRFGDKPVNLQEKGKLPIDIPRYCTKVRDYAKLFAETPLIGVPSLVSEFEVSKLAMAIRLEELGLVISELPVPDLDL